MVSGRAEVAGNALVMKLVRGRGTSVTEFIPELIVFEVAANVVLSLGNPFIEFLSFPEVV